MAIVCLRAGPAGGRVHYQKDVLRVGAWDVRGKVWRVNRGTLLRLIRNWRLANRRGVRIPVVWNHSHDARDQIGLVTNLYLLGDVLYARFWAAAADDVRRLGVTVNEVSAEIQSPWYDGQGHRYDLMLTHLGVVTLPVVAKQRPFQRLQLVLQGERTMHAETASLSLAPAAATAGAATADGTASAPAALAAAINLVLNELGSPLLLPAGTPASEVTRQLDLLGQNLHALAGEPDAAEAVASGSAADGSPDSPSPPAADSAAETGRLRLQLARVNRLLALERRRAAAEKEAAFTRQLERLVHEGRLAPADKPGLLEAGRAVAFTLSLLAPFERLPLGASVPVQRIARSRADADPPPLVSKPTMDADRAREIARTFKP